MSENGSNFEDETLEDDRPITPTDEDCCGNSCNPCVFDAHKKLLEKWEKRENLGVRKNFLSTVFYKKFVVDSVIADAEEFSLIRLKSQVDRESRVSLRPGQYVILSMGNKMSRPYTPISWTRDSLELLVKIYANGSFTRQLENLKINDEIQIRGPYGDFFYQSNSFSDIVAFCMGSGIAAIYPIAKSIVDDENDETRINIVAGFREILRIPLKKELRQLTDFWNVNCRLQISNLREDEILPSGITIQPGRLDENTIAESLENLSPLDTLILICGTPEFNDSVEHSTRNRGFQHCHVFS